MEAGYHPSADSDLDEDNSPPQTFQVNPQHDQDPQQRLPLATTQLPDDNLFVASNSESVDECDNYRDPRSGTYTVNYLDVPLINSYLTT